MTATTTLSLFGFTRDAAPLIADKAVSGLALYGVRIAEFDTWRPGYAGASVQVVVAGTTTLASLYADSQLSQPIANPLALLTLTDVNGATYGKFAAPVYTYQPYTLFVNQGSQTGIERPPLFALAGADASLALVTSARGGYPVAMQSFVDRDVDATLYGALTPSAGSAVCAATLAAAIGAAAAAGGGRVLLPPLNLPFTNLTLPEGVVLRGKGKGATTLTSTQSGTPAIVLGGDGAGLECLTLDGVGLTPQSIGLQGVGIALPQMNEVVIKRFETGMRFRGILNAVWNDLTVSNCTNNADLRGDADAAVSGAGSEVSNILWDGGEVSLATGYGLRLFFFDKSVRECTFRNILFTSNSGDSALVLKGARGIRFLDCQWASNVYDISIADGDNTAYVALNTTQRIRFTGGRMNLGVVTCNQTCLDVQFEGMEMLAVSFVLTVPTNPIALINCIEDGTVSFAGDLTKLVQRGSTATRGTFSGVTTDATPTSAWERTLDSGSVCLVSARCIARQRDGINFGILWVMSGAFRVGATLPYQSATGTFTVGLVVKGLTSGASARIVANAQAGATGTLTLRDIVGTFINGEQIFDGSNGLARFIGVIGTSSASLDGGGSTALRAAAETAAYAAAVTVSGALVQVKVTGVAATVVEWTVDVDILQP